MSGLQVEGSDLSDRVARLEAENAALRSSLVASEVKTPLNWRLTGVEQKVFQALLANDVTTKQTIVGLLYGAEATPSRMKMLDVFMARIRRKTRQFSVTIETIFGVGYRLHDREAWTKALNSFGIAESRGV